MFYGGLEELVMLFNLLSVVLSDSTKVLFLSAFFFLEDPEVMK